MASPSPSSSQSFPPSSKKRIIICCDGSWKDSDGDVQTPSNVTRISRAIRPIGLDQSTSPPTSIQQIVFYQNGVGTGSFSSWTKYIGGATGEGISLNIREVYSFICLNYREGDEIVLIGFSRGAFTARSVASLIRAIGLLTPAGLEYLAPIFEDWKFQGKKGWKTRFPNHPWSNRPKLDTDEYRRRLLELEHTRLGIPIKCVAVWDTVGALGVPAIWILPQNKPTDYQLVNTAVESNIEHAYQALALDERRRPYRPTIWEIPDGTKGPKVLKQTWFPGVHSDVGGSYDDDDLANVTLAWMISQLDHLITIDHGAVSRAMRQSRERRELNGQSVREWGLGRIHNSMTFFFRFFGSITRSPKEYQETDPSTKKTLPRRLANTNEYVHSSVRIRMGRQGHGYDDKGVYDSPALAGWEFTGTETAPDTPVAKGLPGATGKMKNVVWKKKVKIQNEQGRKTTAILEMPEDELVGYEKQILAMWPELLENFDTMRPGKHRSNIRRSSTYPAVVLSPPRPTSPPYKHARRRRSPEVPTSPPRIDTI